jgi:hypothetical protein
VSRYVSAILVAFVLLLGRAYALDPSQLTDEQIREQIGRWSPRPVSQNSNVCATMMPASPGRSERHPMVRPRAADEVAAIRAPLGVRHRKRATCTRRRPEILPGRAPRCRRGATAKLIALFWKQLYPEPTPAVRFVLSRTVAGG